MHKMASNSASKLKFSQLDAQDVLGICVLRSSDLSHTMPESDMKSVMTSSASLTPDSHADFKSSFSNSAAVCSISKMTLESTLTNTTSTDVGPLVADILKATEIPPMTSLHEPEIGSLPDTTAGVSHVLSKSDMETKTASQPEISSHGEQDSDLPDLNLRICENNRREYSRGLRMRASHFEVTNPRRDVLQPVSDPQEVLIRARGHDRRFLVNRNNILSMSTICTEQMCQAIFQKQEFFDEVQCRVMTTFFHVPTQTYLGVCPDTQKVKLVHRVPSLEKEDTSVGVVSLNGPYKPDESLSLEAESLTGPDDGCLFIVVNNGHTCLKPAICDTMSLDYTDSGSSLRMANGWRWSFSLLPANHAEKYLNTTDLKKLLKKSMYVVLVSVQKVKQH